jgi:hypothetical protein
MTKTEPRGKHRAAKRTQVSRLRRNFALSATPENLQALEDYVTLYSNLAYSVIPIVPGTKKPQLKSWEEYQYRRPSPAELESWFNVRDQMEPNIAVVAGSVSENLLVIDFDDKESYARFFAEPFYTTTQIQERTIVVQTARGVHVHLRSDEAVASFNIPELHVNVQAEGRYALLPPSRHPSGAVYAFLSEGRVVMNVENLGEKLSTRIEQLGCKIPTRLEPIGPTKGEIEVAPWRRWPKEVQTYFAVVQKGERAIRAFQLACTMINEWAFSADKAKTWLKVWNEKLEHPLDETEIDHAVESARRGYVHGRESFRPIVIEISQSDRTEAMALLKTPNLWQQFMTLTDRWVSRDERTRRNVFRCFVSAQTADPMTHSLLGHDSIGKTYVSVNVSRLIPEKFLWDLAGLSPTALVHEHGKWDHDRHGYIIDLSQVTIFLLEPPQELTLTKLKPILSHDKKTVQYKFTDKNKRGGMATKDAFVTGWPAFLMLGVKQHQGGEQTARWGTETPEISSGKTRDVIMKSAERQKNPKAFEDDESVRIWKSAYAVIAEQFPIKTKIPYADIIAKHFLIRGPESGRQFNTFCRLLKANAAVFCMQRKRDQEGYLLCNGQDFEDVLSDFKDFAAPSFLGISGDAFMLYKALRDREHDATLTFEDIALEAKQTFGGDTPENTLREYYIRAMVESGLLHEDQSAADKRRKVYTVVPRDLTKLSVFDDETAVREAVRTGKDHDMGNSSTGNIATGSAVDHAEKSSTQPLCDGPSICTNPERVSDINDNSVLSDFHHAR